MLLSGIKAVNTGLLIKNKVLVYGDLHLGIEESFLNKGMFLPKHQFKKIKEIILNGIKKYNPEVVVLNGDVKHEFGSINKEEWSDILELFNEIMKLTTLVLIKGNHDKIIEPIAKKKKLKLLTKYIIGTVMITHGDELIKIPSRIKTIVIGHDHPAIEIKEDAKSETYKCFLKGKYKRKNLIVMPSTNQMNEGTDVMKGEFLSPFISDIKKFEVYAVTPDGEEILNFGKVKDLG